EPDSLDRPKPAAPPKEEKPPEENGGGVKANPEAVDYRTEAETCQHCEYMQEDGMCSHPMVAQQVSPGDSCAAFESREGEGAETPEENAGEPAEAEQEMPAYR